MSTTRGPRYKTPDADRVKTRLSEDKHTRPVDFTDLFDVHTDPPEVILRGRYNELSYDPRDTVRYRRPHEFDGVRPVRSDPGMASDE